MGKSSKDPPQTPTRIPRPFTPTNGTSPTRSNPRRGMGLLQAVGRGDIFRGASRAEEIGRIGVWPLSTTVNEAQGNAVGPMRPAAHQSGIPPPINATYHQNPSRPASSRGPSASIMTGSPDSQLTTGYTSATTSTSPEGVTGDRRRVMSGNSTVAIETSGYHPYAPQVRHRRPGSSLPVRSPPPRPPPEPCDIAYFMPGAWTKRELKLPKSPKVPSGASDDSLGSKHRDSLRLASIQNVPRLTPPGTKKGKFSDFFTNENADSPQSDGSQAKPGQGSGAGSQMSRESSVFEEWPLPVEKLKDSSELELQDARTKESPGAAENEITDQKDIIESKDEEYMGGFTQEIVEQMDADQKESDDLSPGSKKADAELERDHREEPLIMDVSCMLASMGLEQMSDYDPSKHILPGESAPRGPRRQDLLDLSPATDLNNPQSQLGSGSAHKTFDLRSQLPRPTQKAGGEKESGIPKSRTRNVLNNLTSSLSRASLSSFRMQSRRHTPSAMASPNEDDSPARTQRPSGDEDLISSQQASAAHHLDSVRLIYEARDAEWWTGRFLALEDRFRNENLSPENMAAIIAAATKIPGPTTTTASKPQNPAGLPSSSTMACFPSSSNVGGVDDDDDAQKKKVEAKQRAALLTDEDARARRVFAHLHALCMTEAARKSLRAFQQQYARNAGKEALLPPGGTMYEDPKGKGKRWVGRIFSGKDKDKDKEDGGKKGGPSR
ncbi:uncharacterized protein F4807DRAFT_282629 [Annulohypoxylon truncatum]|uniref:uncharacterized protein n=1 Tax=Annulohypoxylon truncatum TaxID=327061 RepID=UPI0020080168|nr:uncharacterized protein F4807DRAFT_282629 [Annulohypoxylon truncatum]KAI1205564.1 hypothetical protein F4807DRAFT_282629 [Annulohypoxylon truncatum]